MCQYFIVCNISSSALTAQRLRMDVISSNMANVDTTSGKLVDGEWEPYSTENGCHGTSEFFVYLHSKLSYEWEKSTNMQMALK